MEGGMERKSMLGRMDQKNLKKMEFEETELRLGLPGGVVKEDQDMTAKNVNGKRNFNQSHVDLKLNLASKEAGMDQNQTSKDLLITSNGPAVEPSAKAQVVGWPPVRYFRQNIVAVQKSSLNVDHEESTDHQKVSAVGLVKVSIDGAPYLRKVNLKMYNTYRHLSDALGNMFHSFTIGKCESQGMMDLMNESKLIDLLNNSDYVSTYEDKDGDWMLVGDVPWEMFVESCKRLRIMKGVEAVGLAPRTLAKCKKLNI
ncbi:hypothetical protein ACH5RR_020226 [Cinchona calisaya]|uniref:Auxin-responsive protein n=1 Tax=Cinchona calisaya TaxID=153742 RepID=A0ABD2ZHN8_9GENT